MSGSVRTDRLRGVVLAAGLGTRLRPLTETIPKPLLPVAGKPILAWTLDRLAAAGCEAYAINLHHLGGRIRDTLGSSYAGRSITYFDEPAIQGTLGALPPMRAFLEAADLIVLVNGDSLCRWPVARVVAHHRASAAAATLLLASRPDPEKLGGGVGIDETGRVVQLRQAPAVGPVARRRVFAGLHVFAPELVRDVPVGEADIVESLYLPLLARGARIESVTTGAVWHDLGAPDRFVAGALDWIAGRPGGRWLAPDATIAPGALIERSIVEAGVTIETGAQVLRSVVLPGATIGTGAQLDDVLVGPGVEIAAGMRAERCLLTVGRRGRPVVNPFPR